MTAASGAQAAVCDRSPCVTAAVAIASTLRSSNRSDTIDPLSVHLVFKLEAHGGIRRGLVETDEDRTVVAQFVATMQALHAE